MNRDGRESLDLSEYNGLGFRHPVLGFILSLFMFSLAGIPPTAGFMGKVYIFSAAVQAGYTWLVIIAVLNSVVAVTYYLGVVVHLYMREPGEVFAGDGTVEAGPGVVILRVGVLTAVGLLIAGWGTLQLGIFPSQVLGLAQLAATARF